MEIFIDKKLQKKSTDLNLSNSNSEMLNSITSFSNVLNICVEEGHKSSSSFRHGAAIVFRNKVVARGHNYCHVNPIFNTPTRWSVHAEFDAIRKFTQRYPKRLLQQATLVVVRVSADGGLMNSKPCFQCTNFILKHKIPTIIYS